MTWTTLTLQVTTPLFMGGADPANEGGFRAADEAGIRAASIRGAMRFWFRALAGAYTGPDIELLAAMERRVFGGIAPQRGNGEAAVPSPLILRLPDPPRLSYEPEPDFLRGHPGIVYLLGLGLIEMKGGARLTRPFVPPGDQTFTLKTRFQHDQRSTMDTQQAIEALALASLWLAATYGGFGARTRRGFGGVRIVSAAGEMALPWKPTVMRTPVPGLFSNATRVWPPDSLMSQLEKHLRELARAEHKELAGPDNWAEPPAFPVLSKQYSAATLVPKSHETWKETLDHAGRQFRLFRANQPDDQRKRRQGRVHTTEWDEVINDDIADFPLGALGLPVGFHNKDPEYSVVVNAVDPATPKPEQLRRASPLWLRPLPVGEEKWQLLTYAFQGRFLPEDVEVRMLPDADARRRDIQEGTVFVDDDQVAELTSQWITTMRRGGDFTTELRR
jgi:CRISPR-associated protein Cmr1